MTSDNDKFAPHSLYTHANSKFGPCCGDSNHAYAVYTTTHTSILDHQERVKEFMVKAKQSCPPAPIIPDNNVILLRARLILEEVFETLDAMGVQVIYSDKSLTEICGQPIDPSLRLRGCLYVFRDPVNDRVDLPKVMDGIADSFVVLTGTAIAMGVNLAPVLEEVDNANLRKFGPGHSYRADGKLIKPPDFVGPNVEAVLAAQGWTEYQQYIDNKKALNELLS